MLKATFTAIGARARRASVAFPRGSTARYAGVAASLRGKARRAGVAVSLALVAGPACAANALDVSALSLEQLSTLTITSVSGHQESLADAPASIYVITAADIRRSGARSLPEALRIAPNLEVARVSANAYAISARGMNNADNKLLVLLDGRILYTPLYSGVLWYAQDVMLEDVERIEVISGPGGTLWGTNAVNGVINVITYPARRTQNGLVVAGNGSRDKRYAARYGGTFEGGAWRVYGKALEERQTLRADGRGASDARRRGQVGLRMDWDTGATLTGDVYDGRVDQAGRRAAGTAGANLTGAWDVKLRDGAALRTQGYWDHTELDVPGATGTPSFRERLDIIEASFQHDLAPAHGQQVSWGGEYRQAFDRVDNAGGVAFLPGDRQLRWASLFAQDRVALTPAMDASAGMRIEHNSYTGLEAMPSARLAWRRSAHDMAWAAISRAVRTPARIDRDLYAPQQPPYLIAGGPRFRSETADVVELGYRDQPTASLSWSVTAFVQRYRHLRSVELIGGRYFEVANQMEGTTSGIEGWATWQVTRRWRLAAGGVYLRQRLHLRADSTDPIGVSAAGNDPPTQWSLRSSWQFPRDVELDVAVRHVGTLPAPLVPSYTATNVRVAWRPLPSVELSLVGESVFDPQHVEFGTGPGASEIPRTVFLNVAWSL
jgi:iron complex outermembrane receptor protein